MEESDDEKQEDAETKERKKRETMSSLRKEVRKMPLHTLVNPPEIEPYGQESISIEVDGIELGATTDSIDIVN